MYASIHFRWLKKKNASEGFIQKFSFGVEVGVAFCVCHISYTPWGSYQKSRSNVLCLFLSLPPSLFFFFLSLFFSLPLPFWGGGSWGVWGGSFPHTPNGWNLASYTAMPTLSACTKDLQCKAYLIFHLSYSCTSYWFQRWVMWMLNLVICSFTCQRVYNDYSTYT